MPNLVAAGTPAWCNNNTCGPVRENGEARPGNFWHATPLPCAACFPGWAMAHGDAPPQQFVLDKSKPYVYVTFDHAGKRKPLAETATRGDAILERLAGLDEGQ